VRSPWYMWVWVCVCQVERGSPVVVVVVPPTLLAAVTKQNSGLSEAASEQDDKAHVSGSIAFKQTRRNRLITNGMKHPHNLRPISTVFTFEQVLLHPVISKRRTESTR